MNYLELIAHLDRAHSAGHLADPAQASTAWRGHDHLHAKPCNHDHPKEPGMAYRFTGKPRPGLREAGNG